MKKKPIPDKEGPAKEGKENKGQKAPPADSEKTGASEVQLNETQLKEQMAVLQDKYLRAAAEVENIRRRSEREKEHLALYAVSALAADLLAVADNLARSRAHLAAKENGGSKAAHDGLVLTERALEAVFARHGIRKIAAQGEMFDPNRHEAMLEKPAAEAKTGQIIEVLQDGYMIGERLLRPALVALAAKPAKPAKPAKTGEQGDGTGGKS